MPSTLVGISPPTDGLVEYVKETVRSIDGTPLFWAGQHSMCQDEERNYADTLLLTATFVVGDDNDEDGDVADDSHVTPEAVIEAVQKALNGNCSDGDSKKPPPPLPAGDGDADSQTYFVEMWASAPAPLPLRPVKTGYDMLCNISGERWGDDAPHLMREFGIVQQENILNEQEVAELRQMVDGAIANVEALLSKYRPEINVGEDSFIFKEIASRNLERFDLRMDTIPGAAEYVERCILDNVKVQSLLRQSLGEPEDIDFDISVVYSRPGAINQRWHADGSHQKGAKDAGVEDMGWKHTLAGAYALCLFIPLIDLDHEVGYTQFWPGSHRHRDLVGFGPVAELTKATYDGISKAGGGVWYDYRLLHRGMFNVSKVVRPVVQVIFKKKWYVEKVNYGNESIIREG